MNAHYKSWQWRYSASLKKKFFIGKKNEEKGWQRSATIEIFKTTKHTRLCVSYRLFGTSEVQIIRFQDLGFNEPVDK